MSIELTGQEIIDLIDECPKSGVVSLDEEGPKLKHYPHVAYCYGYQEESVQPIGDEL